MSFPNNWLTQGENTAVWEPSQKQHSANGVPQSIHVRQIGISHPRIRTANQREQRETRNNKWVRGVMQEDAETVAAGALACRKLGRCSGSPRVRITVSKLIHSK